ncbi:hypothetical protein N7454_010659 [Penicillium verhagenii]|nr:hypothetical protein N7454_010659 [Penicillium verhagenii]
MLDSLPDGTRAKTIQHNQQYRLDQQGPRLHNLQVQVNSGAKRLTSLQGRATGTVSIACVPLKDPWDAARIKDELKVNMNLDEMLDGLPDGSAPKNIERSRQYRLDQQCMTSVEPRYHNLQVQVNSGATRLTSLEDRATDIISIACVPVKDPWDAAKIKEELKANINLDGYTKVSAELKPVAPEPEEQDDDNTKAKKGKPKGSEKGTNKHLRALRLFRALFISFCVVVRRLFFAVLKSPGRHAQ